MDHRGQSLWQISIATSPLAEDAVAELLSRIGRQPATSYHDFRTQRLHVTAYLSAWPQPRQALLNELTHGLSLLQHSGLETAPATISVRRLPPVDWAESWKKHFPTLEISRVLLIHPPWNRPQPQRGQLAIELDPGLSFGTGHHPTTKFCLEELIRARPTQIQQSLLDIGTGSGLLAIAAAKLGYQPIHALDFDPVAIRVASQNLRQNQSRHLVHLRHADLRELKAQLAPRHLVCANLQADLLLDQAPKIADAVLPHGLLILAGILRSEMPGIHSTYSTLGFRCERKRSAGEWTSSAFRRTR